MTDFKRKTPPIRRLTRILIICEGYEEYDYLNALKGLGLWSDKLDVTIKNACCIDNIPARYQYEYANGNYDSIYVFCDTELPPFKQFKSVLAKINSARGKNVAPKIVCFSNPCTMLVFLSHFDKIDLYSNQKSDNAPIIERLTGVSDYRARRFQREKMTALIDAANYRRMKKNLCFFETDYRITPSTNAKSFFDGLESGIVFIN